MKPWLVGLGITPGSRSFPGGSQGKESACNAGYLGPIPGLGRSPGEGNSNTLQYSCLENPIDRGAWWVAVHGVTELDMTERLTHTYKLLVKCMLLRPTVYI